MAMIDSQKFADSYCDKLCAGKCSEKGKNKKCAMMQLIAEQETVCVGDIRKQDVVLMIEDWKARLNGNRCENEIVFLDIMKNKVEGMQMATAKPCELPQPTTPAERNPHLIASFMRVD